MSKLFDTVPHVKKSRVRIDRNLKKAMDVLLK